MARRCRICSDNSLRSVVHAAREQGFSLRHAARLAGIPGSTVWSHERHRLGISNPAVEVTCPVCAAGDEVAHAVLDARMRRWPIRKIALLAACSYDAVRRHLRDHLAAELRSQLSPA